jgi:hypothetical protein
MAASIAQCNDVWQRIMCVKKSKKKNKLYAIEIGYLRRSARKSKLERVPKEETRKIM